MTDPIDIILAGMAKKQGMKRAVNAPHRMGWVTTAEETSLIRRAAEARNISVNAFAQRAVVAMACATLGLDYYHFMQDIKVGKVRAYELTPYTNLRGQDSFRRVKIEGSECGKGAGPWAITGLR